MIPDHSLRICADRGGTFCDIHASYPDPECEGSRKELVVKLLSQDPANYRDAPTEGIRRILEKVTGQKIERGTRLPTNKIDYIRLSTTVATNALLERKGKKHALVITKGFKDLLLIGNQSRPRIFDLNIKRPDPLYTDVIEVDERVTLVGYTSDPAAADHAVQFDDNGKITKGYSGESSICGIDGEPEIVHGLSGEAVQILRKPDLKTVEEQLTKLYDQDFRSIAIIFAHSYTFPQHEIAVGKVAEKIGFTQISLSSQLLPMIKMLPRGVSSTADAYLTPILKEYLDGFFSGFDEELRGGGKEAHEGRHARVEFMGNGLFKAGPESAGAEPGPACYRKGGPLCLTDANLMAGRILPDYFPKIFGKSAKEPLDVEASRTKFDKLREEINAHSSSELSLDEIVYGFIKVANETMCRPIRALTEAKGYSTDRHLLATFGGAGGQHAGEIARLLGIKTVLIHRYSSILSAYGLSLADRIYELQEPSSAQYTNESHSSLIRRLDSMEEKARAALRDQGFPDDRIQAERYLNMRFDGTDTSLMILGPSDGSHDFEAAFKNQHKEEFGFLLEGKTIMVDDFKVRGLGKTFDTLGDTVHEELKTLNKRNVEKSKLGGSVYTLATDGVGQVTTIAGQQYTIATNAYVQATSSAGSPNAASTRSSFPITLSLVGTMAGVIMGAAFVL
ncbi:hypothetical protein FRC20_002390 [Serendipita sp. 405]|nr:hypothetical protein FRC20_002390 [Serendipita sp. 405]